MNLVGGWVGGLRGRGGGGTIKEEEAVHSVPASDYWLCHPLAMEGTFEPITPGMCGWLGHVFNNFMSWLGVCSDTYGLYDVVPTHAWRNYIQHGVPGWRLIHSLWRRSHDIHHYSTICSNTLQLCMKRSLFCLNFECHCWYFTSIRRYFHITIRDSILWMNILHSDSCNTKYWPLLFIQKFLLFPHSWNTWTLLQYALSTTWITISKLMHL